MTVLHLVAVLLADADPAGFAAVVLAVVGLGTAVVNWLGARAARAERDLHSADAAETRRKLAVAHGGLEALHAGVVAHEDGEGMLDCAITVAHSDGVRELLEHLSIHGNAPPIAPPPVSANSAPVARTVGALLFAAALMSSGCTAQQIAAAEAGVHKLAVGAQASLAAFKANEVTIDQLAADASAALAKSKDGTAAAAKVEQGLALVKANPQETDLLEEGLAELAAATAPAPSPSPTPAPAK